jgi:transposase
MNVAVSFQNAACLTPKKKGPIAMKGNRIIGLDLHPDVFAAAALSGANPLEARLEWVHDRQATAQLETWAKKHLVAGDTVVLEASGNSFEVAHRLHACGVTAIVLESAQASHIQHNFCNDDRHSAVKLARVYLSGLAKTVWQPDPLTRERREVFFAHRNAVKDTTRCRSRIRSFLNEYCVRLAVGTALTEESGWKLALARRAWTALQQELITQMFQQLWAGEKRRKALERVMVRELAGQPAWARLWRLMGVRHRVAFALMAMIGDIHRFPTAKKLVGYLGLSPRREQSGNDPQGREKGLGSTGRGDVRALLIQSAQNALEQRASPLHKWGWKLALRKHRNHAVAALARKLTVAIWHLLMGHFTPLVEATQHLTTKLLKLATVLGRDTLRQLGFPDRQAFVDQQIKLIQLST